MAYITPGGRYRATNPDLYHHWSFPWTNPTPGNINGFSFLSGKKVRIKQSSKNN